MHITKKRLSQYHPVLYELAVFKNRAVRRLKWFRDRKYLSRHRQAAPLPHLLVSHELLLRRRLGGTDPLLQEGKIRNLALGIPSIDSLVLQPGEVFSFWRQVGRPSRSRGFVDGLVLRGERTDSGVGGGLCQLANLIYWMALNSPLEILERHHHSLDFFPDNSRRIPFGSGASVMYNYLDLVIRNPLSQDCQIKVSMDNRMLYGELRCERGLEHSYSITEKNHRFVPGRGFFWRKNELWLEVRTKNQGQLVRECLMATNEAKVLYDCKWIPPAQIQSE